MPPLRLRARASEVTVIKIFNHYFHRRTVLQVMLDMGLVVGALILALYVQSNAALFNLAVEECIFRQMDPAQRVLFLWRNANTVVIGRAQNPWKECNTRRMEEDGVTLARRSSGGGAVFHDLGNSCFTFMAGKLEYDKSVSTAIVLDALRRLGVEAFASGRNDLLVATPDGDRKVSGSAYRETQDRGFHHGTLLLDAHVAVLQGHAGDSVAHAHYAHQLLLSEGDPWEGFAAYATHLHTKRKPAKKKAKYGDARDGYAALGREVLKGLAKKKGVRRA